MSVARAVDEEIMILKDSQGIGRGASGSVHVALDRKTGQELAVKVCTCRTTVLKLNYMADNQSVCC